MANKAQKNNKGLLKKSSLSPASVILVALVFGLVGGFVLRSLYAAPVKGNTKQSTVSSIAIATVAGSKYDPVAKTPVPKLGDMMTFNTTVEAMPGWEYPMIVVACYQDVNGDGVVSTEVLSPDIVYSWLDHPEAAQQLGAAVSIWSQRGGGPATCTTQLDAYGWKGGKESIRVLAQTPNWQSPGY